MSRTSQRGHYSGGRALGLALGLTLLPPPCGLARAQDSVPLTRPVPDTARIPASGRLGALEALPPIAVGTRIRVRRHAFFTTEGTVVAIRGDTFSLRRRALPGLRVIRLEEGHRVDLRLGRASRARGALLGGAAGAVGSALLAAQVVHGFGGSVFGRDADTVGDLARLILPFGVGIGAVTGALLPGDRWQRVRLRRVGPAP